MLHPAVRLISWLTFVIALPWLAWPWLAVATVVLAAAGRWLDSPVWRGVVRARWLLIVLFGIYALTTPGTPLSNMVPAITREGLVGGGMQAWRLLLVMLALGVATAHLSHPQIMSAIYALLLPLRRFGFSIDRFVARLALTLRYAETLPAGGGLDERMARALGQPTQDALAQVEFELAPVRLRDVMFLSGVFGLLAIALW